MKTIKLYLFLSFVALLTWSCNEGLEFTPPPDTETDINPAFYDTVNALGFYDYTKNDRLRPVRNDLEDGFLTGMVQFAQTHTVDPNGNEEKNMPDVIMDREALLLFTPSPELMGYYNKGIAQITAEISIKGEFKGRLHLNHPNLLLKSDYNNKQGKPDVIYSRRAWSAVIPYDWMKPGITIRFTDNKNRTGVLREDKTVFGPPAFGIFSFIRLGMLTDFPTDGDGAMMTEPAKYMTDYFQTVPFAKVVNVTYENRSLPKVIVANGTVYDNSSSDPKIKFSQSSSGVYSGDMRENVGKSQVSVGINLANYGITSSNMSQSYNKAFFSMTVHLSQGMYVDPKDKNKGQRVRHGLSGGNGIGTLIDTVRNEFSHEVGHAYGLGHFPGAVGNDYFWSAHHADSGWGYGAYRKFMRANLAWKWDGTGAVVNGVKSKETFKHIYSYNRDTMAGGEAHHSAKSVYTYLTGYSMRRVQNFLANFAVPDLTSSTGYKKWNHKTQSMEEHTFPESTRILKPKKIGVPVFTIIGGYNPDNSSQSVIYEPFRANYGNVFTFPPPDKSEGSKSCWVTVNYKNGDTEDIEVLSKSGTVYQFAINLEEAQVPTKAELYCKDADKNATRFQSILIPQGLPPMPKAVIVGMEHWFNDIKDIEIAQLNKELPAYKNDRLPVLTSSQSEKLTYLADNLSELTPEAKSVADTFIKWKTKTRDLIRYLKKNKDALDYYDTEIVDELKRLLKQEGFIKTDTPKLEGEQLIVEGKCLKMKYEPAVRKNVLIIPDKVADCDNGSSERWVMDLFGRIHSEEKPSLCITPEGGSDARVGLVLCNMENPNQIWFAEENGRLRSNSNNKRFVLDFARHKKYPVLYSPGGGSNQRWETIVHNHDLLPAMLPAEELEYIYNLYR